MYISGTNIHCLSICEDLLSKLAKRVRTFRDFIAGGINSECFSVLCHRLSRNTLSLPWPYQTHGDLRFTYFYYTLFCFSDTLLHSL